VQYNHDRLVIVKRRPEKYSLQLATERRQRVTATVHSKSLSAGSRPEIQEEGRVMELENFLLKYSRRSWREANWVRLSATS